ncbi:hypothetical protein OUZ56_014037 [Daphnia magna]|uniref:Uncharacterized protein n=1 Tax=Daphnia magna TaxID=35525 RepID=A0ABQ9Z7P5_9CRUS|nr:hypothetical protein OUZ56_014037 [Daphnia magna]
MDGLLPLSDIFICASMPKREKDESITRLSLPQFYRALASVDFSSAIVDTDEPVVISRFPRSLAITLVALYVERREQQSISCLLHFTTITVD